MLKYLRKYAFFAILAPLFMIGEVTMDLLQPQFMSVIVDDGVLGLASGNAGNLSVILNTGVKMILIVVAGGISGVLSGVFANLCSQNLGNDLRKDAFKKMMYFSFEQTEKFTPGSLITRITNDVTQVQNLVTMSIRGFVRMTVMFIGGIYCMLQLNIEFGYVILIVLPLVLGGVFFVIRKSNPLYLVVQRKLDRINQVMQENLDGVRVVKAYVREDGENEKFQTANDDFIHTHLRILLLFASVTPLLNIIMNIAIVAVIYVGGIQVQNGNVTPGNVMAAITYVTQILNSVMMLTMMFQTISRGSASIGRINEILQTEPVIVDGEGAKYDSVKERIKGKIEFRHVHFSYGREENQKQEVLKDVSFTVLPRETIGILGATGSGKSTLVKMIPRFYEVLGGEVFVDDLNVKEYPLQFLRDKIAIVMQKTELFSGTVTSNMLWGNPEALEEEIKEALIDAQAWDFIEKREGEMEATVEQKGMGFSGGQKQRLSIARALMKNPEIIIFDDSTSALDLKTEALLYKSVKKKFPDSTKLIIAQRIASVRDADRILVLDDGQVKGYGTHEELLKSCSIYQDIYHSQMKSDKGGAVI